MITITGPPFFTFASLMSFEESTKFLSNEEIELKKKAINALVMPLAKREPNDIKHLEWDFFWIWQSIVIDHKIDHEHLFTFPSYEIGIDDFDIWEREEDETARAILNHESWIKEAKEDFAEDMKVFYSRLATEQDYQKHFSNPNWGLEKILNISEQRALLLPNTNMDLLDKIFVELIEAYHAEMFFGMAYNYIVKTRTMVGYSNRKECFHLLYKIDANNQLYHVYPIHAEEVKYSIIEFHDYSEDYLSYVESVHDYERRPTNYFETTLL